MSLASTFLNSASTRSRYYKELAEKTFAQISDDEFWFSPNPENNSIAVNICHMAGNMLSRWTDLLSSDGEKEWRNRDGEFEPEKMQREELLAFWEKGWACYLGALDALTEDDLLKTIYIRKEPLTVVDAINRQLAHYPYHVGQIVFIGKLLRDGEWKNLSIPKRKRES